MTSFSHTGISDTLQAPTSPDASALDPDAGTESRLDGGRDHGPGKDAEQQRLRGLRRLHFILPAYFIAIGLMAIAVWKGLTPWHTAAVMTGAMVGGYTCFYTLLASGLSKRFKDPRLICPQVVYSIAMGALSYAIMEGARALALQWLSLVIIFDVQRLGTRQMRWAAASAMAMPVLGIVVMETFAPEGHIDLTFHLVSLGWGAVLVPALLLVGRQARRIRQRQVAMKNEMGQAVVYLRELSVRDALTGLTNRRHMQELLQAEEQRFLRSHRSYTVALLDIDHFKQINDRFGHGVGDRVLHQFATLAAEVFTQAPDTFARWGGEEFLLLMPEAQPGHAAQNLQALRDKVHAFDWCGIHAELKPRFSAGICAREDAKSLRQALERADAALYSAKSSGRDRLAIHGPQGIVSGSTPPGRRLNSPLSRPEVAVQLPVSRLAAASTGQDGARQHEPRRPRLTSRTHRGWRHQLLKLVLGTDDNMRQTIASNFIASFIYLSVMLTIPFYCIPTGLMTPGEGQLLLGMCAFAIVAPYVVVRSGVTMGMRDFALSHPQMAWAMLTIMVAYVQLPVARANILELMCVVLIFGFMNLTPRAAVAQGVMASLMLLAGQAIATYLDDPGRFKPTGHESLQVLSSVIIYALITAQSYNFAKLRQRVRQERRDLTSTAEQIKRLTTHDALTGLVSRQHMQGLLQTEMERHQRSGHGFSIALIDLDHFKAINDTHGHATGDAVLQGFAKAALGRLRITDVLARWGGEEFLVILPEATHEDSAHAVLERVRAHIAEHLSVSPDGEGGTPIRVTFSAGVATHQPDETLDHLLERADRALYDAKAQGRNRCVEA